MSTLPDPFDDLREERDRGKSVKEEAGPFVGKRIPDL